MASPDHGVMPANGTFPSGNLVLQRYLAWPAGHTPGSTRLPGLVLAHGFPAGPIDARHSAGTFPELIDRVANEMGWVAMTFTFRGCGTSEGNFSLAGWADDLRAAIDHLIVQHAPAGVWLVGTATGGSLAACIAADDRRVRGVGMLAARSDFDDWAEHPRRFLVEPTEDFLHKAAMVLALLRHEVPECCRHHVRRFFWDDGADPEPAGPTRPARP
jgi:predicted alpha/beta-fold hydrolase